MKCLCCRTLISHTLDSCDRKSFSHVAPALDRIDRRPGSVPIDEPSGTEILPDWVSAHIDECDACRNYYHSCAAAMKRLYEDRSQNAPVLRQEVGLRVMDAVRKSEFSPAGGSNRSGFRLMRAAVLHAAAIALIIGLWFMHPPVREPVREKPLTTAMNDLSTIGRKMMDKYVPLEKNGDWVATISDPLHKELDRLTEDAETVKRAIADFLPMSIILVKAGRLKHGTSPINAR